MSASFPKGIDFIPDMELEIKPIKLVVVQSLPLVLLSRSAKESQPQPQPVLC